MSVTVVHANDPCPCCSKTVPYARLHTIFDNRDMIYCPTCRRRFAEGEEVNDDAE